MTIEMKTPYQYQGNGVMLIAERDSSGAHRGFKDIGKCSEISLEISEEILTHYTQQQASGHKDVSLVRRTDVDVKILLNHIDTDNLERFLKATYTLVSAGSDVMLPVIELGYRYPLNYLNVSNALVTNMGNTATYVEDSHYKLDAATGSVEIIDPQPVLTPMVPGAIRIAYDYSEQKHLEYGFGKRSEYYFRFEGLNIAESNVPVVLNLYRVGFHLMNQFYVQRSKSSELVIQGAILQDGQRPEGAQFFSEQLV